MKIRAKLAFKNEVALAAREKLSLTQTEVAKALGVGQNTISAIECMQFGRLSAETIRKVADFYGVDELAMAPLELRTSRARMDASLVREVPMAMLLEFRSGNLPLLTENPTEDVDREIDAATVKDVLTRVLDTIPDRERRAIALRYGLEGEEEHSLAEVGEILGVGNARAQQLVEKGKQRLGHPVRRKRLERILD